MIIRGALLIVIMIACLFTTGYASTDKQNTTKRDSTGLLDNAEALMKERRFTEAKASLETLLSGMPPAWKAIAVNGDSIRVAYWDEEHFSVCFIKDSRNNIDKVIDWVLPSYSKAYYLLAYMSAGSRNLVEADKYIDKALALEPEHPTLLDEKGMLLQLMGDHENAVKHFNMVIHSNGCVTPYEKARALRGLGISLIDLGRIDEAEQAFQESLKIAPNNKVALAELDYIKKIRSGIKPTAPIGISSGRSQ